MFQNETIEIDGMKIYWGIVEYMSVSTFNNGILIKRVYIPHVIIVEIHLMKFLSSDLIPNKYHV